jgi:hypothetical protein
MLMPVAAYGSQERLQQGLLLHGPVGPQTVPAVVQPPAPDDDATPHVPRLAPAAFVQRPPQQSRSVEQASPFCVQNEASPQMPLWQSCEQQSPLAAHVLPDVLHVVLSGVHAPLVHLPPQHWPSAVHAVVSEAHCLSEHAPPTQAKLQHSSLVLHAVVGAAHALVEAMQSFVVASQFAVQQSALVAHAPPTILHTGPTRGSPSDAAPSPSPGPPSLVSTAGVSLPQPVKIGLATIAGIRSASAAMESLFTMHLE